MLDWTDRHQRYFMRLITQQTLLYTEMVTTGALIYGDRDRYLQFNKAEHPIALQLGGSDAHDLAECARMAVDYDYDEINLNVGCPSDRVQKGAFGACLMKDPNIVAECVDAMQQAAPLTPITVKNRIGVDDHDSYEELTDFITKVSAAGCGTFIIHARKAWLKGLSPKENRDVPPLDYPLVYQLKKDFPNREIIINGGITTLEACEQHCQHVDGVMVGREAYHNPYLLIDVDEQFFGQVATKLSRHEVLEQFREYLLKQLEQGVPLKKMTRHLLGLFHAQAGARAWRRHLSENAPKKIAGINVFDDAKKIQLNHQKTFDLQKRSLYYSPLS